MNLLQKLLASAKVGDVIDFGIIDDVILKDATNEEQVYDGQVLEKNCFLRFQRFNVKGEVYQESRFSFWNANPKEDKRPLERLINQMKQLTEISTAVDPKCGDEFNTNLNGILESVENMQEKARSTKKDVAKNFQKEIVDSFVDNIKPYLETESRLRLKVVTSWDGKYMNLPDAGSIIESMDIEKTLLSISHTERTNYIKGLTPSTPAATPVPEANGTTPKTNPILADL